MNKKSGVAGLLLIVMGLLVIMTNSYNVTSTSNTLIGTFWPTFILIFIGLLFHAVYLLSDWQGNAYFLIPGGILVTLGVFFQVAVIYDAWAYVWPGFILAPAIAFTELYWLGGRPKWALIPSTILFSISIVLFLILAIINLLNIEMLQWFLAAVLIIGGFIIILKSKFGNTVEK